MSSRSAQPRAILFGQVGHAHSDEAAAFLSSLDFVVDIVHSARRGDALPSWVKEWSGDYIFSFRNYYILPSGILGRARHAAINFHPGPPEYPGTGAANWALYDERTEFGVTAHLMNADVDAGPILDVVRFPMGNCDLASLILEAQDYNLALFKKLVAEIREYGMGPVIERASQNASVTWTGGARKAAELDALQCVGGEITELELKRRVKALHLTEHPLFTEIHGMRFFYKS